MNRELKTNEDLVKDLMNFSPCGALGQVFVVQAIQKYADKVVANKEILLAEEKENADNGQISLVSMEGWIKVAEDVQKRMKDFYNK